MKICPICSAEFSNEMSVCPHDGARLLVSREWEVGTVVSGKYRILGKIGRGGMGIVYKAEHITLEELRALKVMDPQLCSDPKFLQRFRREAQAARRLRDENIVRVDDLDQADDGSMFIAMEYVEGVGLRQLMTRTRGPLAVPRALAIARDIAGALAVAHSHGMVHRDIKPDNILLARDAYGRDVPKVLDFGLVGMRESSTQLSTRGPLGTPAYAPPEQWRGMPASELDGRADLYALGMVLYEMLSGKLPFEARTQDGWMRAHLDQKPEPPSVHNPDVTPDVDGLVLRLLEKDRENRFATAEEVVDEIRMIEAQAAWGAVTVPPERGGDKVRSTPPRTPVQVPPRTPPRTPAPTPPRTPTPVPPAPLPAKSSAAESPLPEQEEVPEVGGEGDLPVTVVSKQEKKRKTPVRKEKTAPEPPQPSEMASRDEGFDLPALLGVHASRFLPGRAVGFGIGMLWVVWLFSAMLDGAVDLGGWAFLYAVISVTYLILALCVSFRYFRSPWVAVPIAVLVHSILISTLQWFVVPSLQDFEIKGKEAWIGMGLRYYCEAAFLLSIAVVTRRFKKLILGLPAGAFVGMFLTFVVPILVENKPLDSDGIVPVVGFFSILLVAFSASVFIGVMASGDRTAPTAIGLQSEPFAGWQLWFAAAILVPVGLGAWLVSVAPTRQPPVIEYFRAEPEEITLVQKGTLSWRVQNGRVRSPVRIHSDSGEALPIAAIFGFSAEGTLSVSPTKTTTYTLTARGYSGEVEQKVTIRVRPLLSIRPNDTSPNPSPRVAVNILEAVGSGKRVASLRQDDYFLPSTASANSYQNVRMIQGRAFTSAEIQGLASMLMLQESVASTLFPNGDAVGQQVRIGSSTYTVVGVFRIAKPQAAVPPPATIPAAQSPRTFPAVAPAASAPAPVTPEEQFQLAAKYEKEYRANEATLWYGKAAEQGHAKAQMMYGKRLILYEKKPDEGLNWMRKAALQGDAQAQLELADTLGWWNGRAAYPGVQKNYAEAKEWYRKSMTLGNAQAAYHLATAASVAGENEESCRAARFAADRGYVSDYKYAVGTFHQVAECYRNGWGVPRDNNEALRWYRLSAQKGDSTSMTSLAQAYEFGQLGVPVDWTEVYFWRLLWVENIKESDRNASHRDYLQKAEARLNSGQIESAKRRLADWLRQYPLRP